MKPALTSIAEPFGEAQASPIDLAEILQKMFPEAHWPTGLTPAGLVQLMASKRPDCSALSGLAELLAAMVRPPAGLPLDRAARVDALLAPTLAFAAQERCVALPLDGSGRATWIEPLSSGSIDRCELPLRELMRVMLRAGAKRVILAHNHPSGDASPSDHDRRMTESLAQRLESVGFELVDHLVISRAGFASAMWPGEVQRRAWLRLST